MKIRYLLITLTCLLLLAASLGSANDDILWSAYTGGGGHTANGSNTLDSAIGQPTAGLYIIVNHMVCSGFLCETLARWPVYLPVVSK